VRAANLRCVEGSVRVVLDWSNALVGDPALELARLAEWAGRALEAAAYSSSVTGVSQCTTSWSASPSLMARWTISRWVPHRASALRRPRTARGRRAAVTGSPEATAPRT
jgi:aminoglycoside phosphotransferase (APT) family kinase protein